MLFVWRLEYYLAHNKPPPMWLINHGLNLKIRPLLTCRNCGKVVWLMAMNSNGVDSSNVSSNCGISALAFCC